MEAAAFLRSSYAMSRPSNFVVKSGVVTTCTPDIVYFSGKCRSSNRWIKMCPSISLFKQGQRRSIFGSRKSTLIRASSSSHDSTEPSERIAPLELESPVGQFLSQILRSHPHLVPAAVDQQLEQLQTDRDADKLQKEEPSTSGTDLILYRRIAEVKENERQKALEEILYALVVQKFMDADVSLIPTIPSSASDTSARVDTWPSEEKKLKQLHSPEAYEMIKHHLTLILGNRIGDVNSIAQISKLRVGQVYAASVMYGYFLKRVDQRFQLEKNMKILPYSLDEEENDIERAVTKMRPIGGETLPHNEESHAEASSWGGGTSHGGFGSGAKSSRLRTYVMSFDAETLQRYATIRSKEAISIIEKHTEALFGRPEIIITHDQSIDSSKDKLIRISFGGLKRLVMEAVTFGSFLWDVESSVDSRYHFVMN